MNTAIIAAAGSGSRFASEIPKQFVEILGKPLVVHTLERFAACSSVDAIVLVLPKDRMEQLSEWNISIGKPLTVVSGGPTRAESVRKGLAAVDERTEIVAVHDAARPLVSCEAIVRTIDAAGKFGAACLVAKIADSIKLVENGKIRRSVDRESLRRALTPQAFKLDILRRAFDEDNFDPNATDEASLVEQLEYYSDIVAVEGNSRNIKITQPEDLIIAEALLSMKASE